MWAVGVIWSDDGPRATAAEANVRNKGPPFVKSPKKPTKEIPSTPLHSPMSHHHTKQDSDQLGLSSPDCEFKLSCKLAEITHLT